MKSRQQESLDSRPVAFYLALLSILAFLPALGNGFVYDDEGYILRNPNIGELTPGNLWTILTEPYFGNFHPLHHLLIALQRALFGLNPLGWHALSLLLHGLNTALLYRVLLRLGIGGAVSVAGTALFAVHPLQAESVAWISEQKNLLSLLFVLLSLGAYLRARATGSLLPWIGSLLAFFLALAAKVSAVALPPVLMAIEIFSPRVPGAARGGALARTLPFLLLAGLWANFGITAHGEEGFIHPWPGGSPGATLLTIAPVLVTYAGNLLWPLDLAAAYDLQPASAMPPGELAACWALVLAAGLGLVHLARRDRRRRVALGLVWISAFLLPVINLIPIGTLLNDRYLYAPLCAVGPLLAGGLLAALRPAGTLLKVPSPVATRIGVVSAGLLLLFLSAGAWERARVWKDEGTLWTDAAARSERSALARFNLGTWWLEQGRADLAEAHLRAALEADPTMTRPYHNLGVIYYGRGKFSLAAKFFEGGLRLAPDNYDLWMGLGAARAGAGDRDPAAAAFREALRLRPRAGAPLLAQGLLLAEGGEETAAATALRAFLASGEGDAGQRRLAGERIRNLER